MSAAKTALGLLLILAITACGREQRQPIVESFPYHRDTAINETRRVLLLPAFRGTAVGRSARSVDQAMATAWRELGLFEVVRIDDQARDLILAEDVLAGASIASEALRRFRVAYGVDAILVSRIDHLQSYDPVAIGLQAALVDCGDGTVLWSGSGHFDSARHDVQDDIASWYDATIGQANQHIAGWRSTLQSPRLFARYVCDRLAATARPIPTNS